MYRMASAGIYFADFAGAGSGVMLVFNGDFIVARSAWVLTRIFACFRSRRFCLALSPLNLDIDSPLKVSDLVHSRLWKLTFSKHTR